MIKKIENVYAVQAYDEYKWRTIYVSSFKPEAEEAYDELVPVTSKHVRLVWFSVEGVDFLATQCRDFRVLEPSAPNL